jgi:hypothetical protein
MLAGLMAGQERAAAAASVLDRLKGGVNVERDQVDVISDADLDYMRAVGIRALRVFMWPKADDKWGYLTPGQPMDPEHNHEIQTVGRFITRAIARDIAVIIVPFGGSAYKPVNDPKEIAMQVGWMEEFAAYAAYHWDPGWLFIETWNEPLMDSAEDWRAIEAQLIAAVRRKGPEFTVVATSVLWSSRDAMVKLVPQKDKKVIYDLHYYLPMDYTHQGLPWMGEHFKPLCNLPYPGIQGYDAAQILADVGAVAAWGKKNKVKIVMGEFGVANRCTSPTDKAAYLRDVRAAAEKFGMGWLVWEYSKSFSIAEKDEKGRFRIAPAFLDALRWKEGMPAGDE